MSEADAENVTTAPDGPVAGVVMLPGTLTVGGVVSSTVTWKSSEKRITGTAALVSVAVHVTVHVPIWNVVPDGGAQSTTSPGTTVVGSVHVTTAPEEDVASTTWSRGEGEPAGGDGDSRRRREQRDECEERDDDGAAADAPSPRGRAWNPSLHLPPQGSQSSPRLRRAATGNLASCTCFCPWPCGLQLPSRWRHDRDPPAKGRTMNANKALWEKGDFTRIAETMRESGEAFVATLGITPGLEVLDLGCGDGTTAVPEAKLGADVLGVDIAEQPGRGGQRASAEPRPDQHQVPGRRCVRPERARGRQLRSRRQHLRGDVRPESVRRRERRWFA